MSKAKEKKQDATASKDSAKSARLKEELGQRIQQGMPQLDRLIFQTLVNEGKYNKVLNARRPSLTYNEKELRDAAHAEVAVAFGTLVEPESADKKRKFESEEKEKEKLSRDRNKEHAKFTRLRKKAYVSKLEGLLKDMNSQTDAEEVERMAFGERIHLTQTIRKEQVKQFLALRSGNCRNRAEWSRLLSEEVVFTLPVTPYRSFPRREIVNSARVVRGIDAVMADSASLALLAESIGQGSPQWLQAIRKNAFCKVEYACADSDIVCAGDLIMCRYALHIAHCDAVGGPPGSHCVLHGMMQCAFHPVTEKMQAIDMMFDANNFLQQLLACGANFGREGAAVMANTVEASSPALLHAQEPQAVVSAAFPYTVLNSNETWRKLTGQIQFEASSNESTTKQLSTPLLQALRVYKFQREDVLQLASSCAKGTPGSFAFLSHDWRENNSQGTLNPLIFYIKVLPLTSAHSDEVSHLLVSLVPVPLSAQDGRDAAERARRESEAL